MAETFKKLKFKLTRSKTSSTDDSMLNVDSSTAARHSVSEGVVIRRHPTVSERQRKVASRAEGSSRLSNTTRESNVDYRDIPFAPPYIGNAEDEEARENAERFEMDMSQSQGYMGGNSGRLGDENEEENYSNQRRSEKGKEIIGSGRRSVTGDGTGSGSGRDRGWKAYLPLDGPLDGGPSDPELLRSFKGHVAYYVWNRQDRGALLCHNGFNNLQKWRLEEGEMKTLVDQSGLAHLSWATHPELDAALLSAFVERWQPETNAFHMPFGEMSISLHDVAYILRIPIGGQPIGWKIKPVEMKQLLLEMLGIHEEAFGDRDFASVKMSLLREQCMSGQVDDANAAAGYLLWLVGNTLFVDKKKTHVLGHFLPYLQDVESLGGLAWGAACLASLYRNLGRASRADGAQLGGCLTLLQRWIYEYFPAFSPAQHRSWVADWPASAKWQVGTGRKREPDWDLLRYRHALDGMKFEEVNWLPFGPNPAGAHGITLYRGLIHCPGVAEPYMPDRFLRQFGFIQAIPHPVLQPKSCYRGPEIKRYSCVHDTNLKIPQMYPKNKVLRGVARANYPEQTCPEYLDYFLLRTHVRVSPDDIPSAEPIDPKRLSAVARLQYIAGKMYYAHPRNRNTVTAEERESAIEEVCLHLEDLMPSL